jgi:hypothetical protein
VLVDVDRADRIARESGEAALLAKVGREIGRWTQAENSPSHRLERGRQVALTLLEARENEVPPIGLLAAGVAAHH